jgi:gliding motility-associated-like protein
MFVKDGKHKYASDGQYDITLIVVTDSSCKDTSQQTIKIPPLPEPNFDYTVPPCDSLVQFSDRSSNAVKYFWEFGDNDTSTQQNPLHMYSISGYVPVKLTVTSAYRCPATLDQNIFFISKKVPNFDLTIDSCSGEIQFIDLSNHAALYSWDFGDGTKSSEVNPIHKYPGNGIIEVKLVINPETACPDSITKRISYEVPLGEKVFIPNTFTPNGDGHNDTYTISIFRPCETYKLWIYNRWGQNVFYTEDALNFSWDGSFNGEKLAEDVYVYILEGDGQRREGTITILR